MLKYLIPIATAASALTIAAPASAQWAPPVYRYQPYVYTNGFSYRAFAASMENRVQRMRNDIRVMQGRRILSYNEARNLDRQADNLQRRIYRASRNGIQPGEARRLETQIRNLEYRIQREATDWNNRYGGRHHRY
jgi:hypothetical protein